MRLFSRREAAPPAPAEMEAAPEWIPLTGEVLTAPAVDMGDDAAADAWAHGVTFYLEEQQDSDLTLWLYPAWDEDGELVLGRRFEHRAYYGDDPWSADTYGTVGYGMPPYPDLDAAHDEAQRMVIGYAQETITADPAEADGTGFGWDGEAWD